LIQSYVQTPERRLSKTAVATYVEPLRPVWSYCGMYK
jgi:hypothetical protein